MTDKSRNETTAATRESRAPASLVGLGVAHNVRESRNEMDSRLEGMSEALLSRMQPNVAITDNGRRYRTHSLVEMGREFLELHGVDTRGLGRMEVAREMLQFRSGMHATGDFGSLLTNAAHKRLRSAYDENPGTYRIWARRAAGAPDFRNINVVQLSGAPDLLRTNEHGEFKYGTMADGKESYSLITYGRIVSLTRQAIVNDDLRAFDRLLLQYAVSARRLENRLVYSRLTANAALSDGIALFHADHGNLDTGAGSALQESSLAAGRKAMRLQKGLQGEELNLAPAFLIVPATQEQAAYKLTSPNFVPAKPGDVNEFRAGGRSAVEPVIEPLLDASSTTAWYLAAHSAQIDTVEYCYLDGLDGPELEVKPGFEVDGVSIRCRLDFAAKDIDHRGLYKAAGQ